MRYLWQTQHGDELSLLSVRGECRHMSLRSDLRQNRHLVTPCTTLSNLSTHPGTDLCVYIDFWRSRPPEYTSLLAPDCSLIYCSAAVCMFNTIFYSRQVDKMYIIHTAKLAGLTSRQVMVMLWLSSKAEYWTYQTKKRKVNTEWKLWLKLVHYQNCTALKWLNIHLCHSYDLTIGLLYFHSCMVPECQPTASFYRSIVSSLFHSYPGDQILTEIRVCRAFVMWPVMLMYPFPFVHFDRNSGG